PLLRHEACALVRLQGHPSIPKVFAFGASQYYEYLAFQRLGEDLHSYFTNSAQPLSLGNVVSIAYQMLDVLEHTHARGIIHCDIKPSNIMFDVRSPCARIDLIDFGVCRTYKDPSTGQHRPDKPMQYRRGYTYFATPSRRDDLESLAYVLIWLLRGGELPWRPVQSAEVYEIKSRSSGTQLCPDDGWPLVFAEFLDSCRGLQYAETPNYAFWRRRCAGTVEG
ncbi:kinase-like protein, partial [Polyporus arcularius HHB13444]